MTKHYEQKMPLPAPAKQTQSNPNKANFTNYFERGIGEAALEKRLEYRLLAVPAVFSFRLAVETVIKRTKRLSSAKNSGIIQFYGSNRII